jgi:hypothetical protein
LVVLDDISAYLSQENPIVKDYLWLIPFTGLCMFIFDILCMDEYMHLFFGNFIKEVNSALSFYIENFY